MLRKPESMDECVYYTLRDIGNGEITVWVFRGKCPQCGKGTMEKPRGDDGKTKIRAKEYICPICKYTAEKDEYEDTLTANAEYTCPGCRTRDEGQIPFKRKSIQGVKTLRFVCAKCKANMDVTQKMKEPKKKKILVIDEDLGEE
jgi:ssDNA-binding Zn-finger/Zn-ribbon topoisomerase 1